MNGALRHWVEKNNGHGREALASLCQQLLPAGALADLALDYTSAPMPDLDLVRRELSAVPTLLGDMYQVAIARDHRHPEGQFFTPPHVAAFMAEALEGASRILDPACGAGALLLPLPANAQTFGVDLDPLCVALTRATMTCLGREAEVRQGDFLSAALHENEATDKTLYDGIISNPPYIRHHLLKNKAALSRHYSSLYGVRLSALASGYVYFMLESAKRLSDDGRMVFITPTEFLDTAYGRAVKAALLATLAIDDVYLFDQSESEFGDTLTTSCVTVMSRRKATRTRFAEAKSVGGTVTIVEAGDEPQDRLEAEEKWTFYFGDRGKPYREAAALASVRLHDVARVRRGIATGQNNFFLLTHDKAAELRIEAEYLVPAIGSQRDLSRDDLTVRDWEMLRDSGRPCYLFWCHRERDELRGTKALEYIETGEAAGVCERYLCKARKPWWSVEKVQPPDIIVTYMNRGGVKFVRNSAGVRVMSTFLNLWGREWDSNRLMAALGDERTRAALESVNRVYGGGLAKIEPGDLAALPLVEPSDA